MSDLAAIAEGARARASRRKTISSAINESVHGARLGRRPADHAADRRARREACSLTATGRRTEPVAKIAPRYGEATPLRLAANAVMAGCRPKYFPLVMLAIEAMCEEPFNLYGVQATTHPCAPLMIVNGPVARELGINCGPQRVRPGHAQQRDDRPRDAPGAGEYRRRDSGSGRHVDVRLAGEVHVTASRRTRRRARGSRCTSSAALPATRARSRVVGAECPHNMNDHESITGLGILTTIAGTMAITGSNDLYY